MYMTTEHVVMRAKAALRTRSRFCLIRMGDGDGIFTGYPYLYSERDFHHAIVYMFGRFQFPPEEITKMQTAVRLAYQEADVVGIAPLGDKGGLWDKAWEAARHNGILDGKELCHCDVHLDMQKKGLYPEIIELANSVALVTCRDVTDTFRRRFPDTPMRWIRVPHEYQAEPKRAYPEQHWPDGYKRILDEIEQTPADLYLVGAGFLGKPYTAHAGGHNRVALDVGSVFDGWAGMHSSRSHFARTPGVWAL